MFREFLNSLLEKQQEKEENRYTNEVVTPGTVFSCDKPPIELIELVDSGGLFPIGIKKEWKIQTLAKQRKLAKKLTYVTELSDDLKYVSFDLGTYGTYEVKVREKPRVKRLDTLYFYQNPFIEKETYLLCLGDALNLYNRCFYNKNYIECIRVIQEVLKSEDGEGFRTWSDC